jgi:TonB family protein
MSDHRPLFPIPFKQSLFATLHRSACCALFLILSVAGRAQQSEEIGDALLHDWVQPEYPAAAIKEKLEGRVVVEFVVEADGHVTRAEVKETSDERFNQAALAAVQQWRFDRPPQNGPAEASAMSVPVVFSLAQLQQKQKPSFPPVSEMPVELKLVPAYATNAPDPEYPDELAEQKLPGQVVIDFEVGLEGKAQNVKVLWASHAAFVSSALRAIEKSEFAPAHQGPLAKISRIRYPVEFQSLGATPPEILEANQLSILNSESPENLPVPQVLTPPVYPFAALQADTAGNATVEFTLGENGRPTGLTVVSATAPEFGEAFKAAIETWSFKPAFNGTDKVSLRLRAFHTFVAPSEGVESQLLAALKPGGPGLGGAAGLDQKLKPLWRGFPAYPQELSEENVAGEAVVEFVVDRRGRVSLPKIVSASRPEFGWAAATAVSQWVFVPPTSKGEPTDIKVRLPVSFPPPKK